jgi:hypothetical protein
MVDKEVNDILLDTATYDLSIVGGDFKIGDSTIQHQHHLLLAGKGDYKLSPLVGVGIYNHLHDHSQTLARDARVEFIKDGMQVRTINNINGQIIVDASY